MEYPWAPLQPRWAHVPRSGTSGLLTEETHVVSEPSYLTACAPPPVSLLPC